MAEFVLKDIVKNVFGIEFKDETEFNKQTLLILNKFICVSSFLLYSLISNFR